MGISMKTRVVQVRIVSNPTSPKCVAISVPVPKWLKTLQTQYRIVRRHFSTGPKCRHWAELVRTLRTQNAGTEMVRYRSVLIPKCPVTFPSSPWWQYNGVLCEIMQLCENRLLQYLVTTDKSMIANFSKASMLSAEGTRINSRRHIGRGQWVRQRLCVLWKNDSGGILAD